MPIVEDQAEVVQVKCIELDVPFCTQAGHTGPLMLSEPGRPILYLDEVA